MNGSKSDSIADYVITPHCYFEMKRRMITDDMVRSVLKHPGQSFQVRPGRFVLQSKIEMAQKTYLIRVFVDAERHPAEVVTAYLTSKISKYWKELP